MSVKRDMIADTMKTDAYKVKCFNCMACEVHKPSKLLTYYWCDFWSTTIDNAHEAFCSFFTPLPIHIKGEDEHAG